MATLEDEIKDLKEKNNELALKVQYWKMTAAQRDDDRLALMKENNELRLKLSRLRNNGGLQVRKLDSALQQASEKALSHLVKASAEIARTMDIAKTYIRDRQELDAQSPRWSTLSVTPNSEKKDKVHRVPPMMLGGQSIQPVVALSRTVMNTSNPVVATQGPITNRSTTERAMPMHMLQDVYIPLTRIDVTEHQNNNMETDTDTNDGDDSAEELGLDDSGEPLEEQQPMSDEEDFDGRRLEAVTEDLEPEDDVETPTRNKHENPLEGPSWLLDTPANSNTSVSKSRSNLEPDSTTEMEDSAIRTSTGVAELRTDKDTESSRVPLSVRVSCEFSPTVRRRKRTSSPPLIATPNLQYSPRPLSSRRNSNNGRVLKVLVAKMRLDGDDSGTDSSPPKRSRSPARTEPVTLMTFDAPSPNGATDARVIVSETRSHPIDKDTIQNISRNSSRRESRESQHSTKHTYDQHRTRTPTFDGQPSNRTFDGQRNQDFDGQRKQSFDGQRKQTCDGQRKQTCDGQRNQTCDGQRNQTCDGQRNQTFDGQPSKSEEKENQRVGSIDKRRGSRLASCDSRSDSRMGSQESRDSDSGSGGGGDSISEGRTRRPRKMITYKEKPLNRKMRR